MQELSAGLLAIFGHGTTEHHDLLLAGEFVENVLDISSHLGAIEHAIALINDEVFDVLSFDDFGACLQQREETTRGGDENMRLLGLECMDIDGFFDTSVDCLDLVVGVLAETLEFVLNLECEFTGVAQNDAAEGLGVSRQLVEHGKHEHCGFTSSGLCLAQDVLTVDCVRDALVLHF